jgi:hypothetical protein
MKYKDFFIAIYTNDCKSYCDEQFFKNLFETDIEEATIRIVDNSLTPDYAKKLGNLTGLGVVNIVVDRDDMKTLFLRNVTDSLKILRDYFLASNCKYFVILESDILPPVKWLDYFLEVIDKADIIGGIYYSGFHSQEMFDNPEIFQTTNHALSGCTLYKREVIESIPFRWNNENLNAFPDAWICYDAVEYGNNFKIANYSKIKCIHLHDVDGSRGLEKLK